VKKLYKARSGIMIDGVCRGISDYTGIDVTVVRVLFIAFALAGFSSVLLYIICAVIFPREPEDTIYRNDGN
jgi:phage shock protein C